MNEALKKELTKIYWENDDKDESPEFNKRYRDFYDIFERYSKILPRPHASQMEDGFAGAFTEFGLSQFLWGYEYALTMLGLNHRGGGVL